MHDTVKYCLQQTMQPFQVHDKYCCSLQFTMSPLARLLVSADESLRLCCSNNSIPSFY